MTSRPAAAAAPRSAEAGRAGLATGRRLATVGLWALIAAGLLFMVLPGVWMVLSSLKTRAEIVAVPLRLLPEVWRWENYPEAIRWTRFPRVFGNSLIVTTSVTIVHVLTCIWGGYVFGKLRWAGRDAIFLALLATMMVPGFLMLIPRYVVVSSLGLLNTYSGMILPAATGVFGIFLTRQFLLGIPDELLDAAEVDGASPFGIFWRIILPLCRPIVAVLAIFVFDWTWDDLLWGILILTDRSMWTLPVAIANLRLQGGDPVELQMAATTLAVLPVLVVFAVLQRQIVQGIALSGVKG